MITQTIEMTVERDLVEYDLEITGWIEPFVRGKSFGPPEKCFPDEGGFAEVDTILCDGKPWTGSLTDAEKERAEQALFEVYQSEAEEDYDDRDDLDYDDDRDALNFLGED